jgi:hypothetical protein
MLCRRLESEAAARVVARVEIDCRQTPSSIDPELAKFFGSDAAEWPTGGQRSGAVRHWLAFSPPGSAKTLELPLL